MPERRNQPTKTCYLPWDNASFRAHPVFTGSAQLTRQKC